MTIIRESPGAALIAKEIVLNCMKFTPKPFHNLDDYPIHLYVIREGKATIENSLSEEEKEKIATLSKNIGLDKGDSINGKLLWVCSDTKPSKYNIGGACVRSSRHSRQELSIKSDKRCFAFIISTWKGENIEPPEPIEYTKKLFNI